MPPYFIPNWEQKFPNSAEISHMGLRLPSSVELRREEVETIVRVFVSEVELAKRAAVE